MADENLNIRIGVDTSDADKGLNKIDKESKQAEKSADELNESLHEVGKSADEASGKLDKTSESIDDAGKSAEETGKKVNELGKGLNNLDNTSQNSLRQQLRATTNEIQSLTLQYEGLSDAEKDSAKGRELLSKINTLTNEAGQLRDVMDDVNQSIKNVASDTSNWDSLGEGINLVSSTVGALTGGMQMLGVAEEDVQNIQAKLQASLAISNALTVAQNALQKQSALMLGIRKIQENAATTAITIRTAAEGKGVIATKAATLAQKAFNFVAKQNPYVLLATALVTVIGALWAFSKGTNEAADQEAKLAAKHEEEARQLSALKEHYASMVSGLGQLQVKYRMLADEYKNMSSTADKTEWINKNKTAFDQLGLSINSLNDAEKAFVDNTSTIIKTFELRVRLANLINKAAEQAEKAYAQQDFENATKTDNQLANGQYNLYHVSENQYLKQAEDVQKELTDLTKELGGIVSTGAKTNSKVGADALKSVKDNAKAAEEAYKIQFESARREEELALETRQHLLDIEKEGNAKRLKQIELDYDKREQEIKEREEDIYEINYQNAKRTWEANHDGVFGGKRDDYRTLTSGQKAEIDAARKANDAERERAITQMRKEAQESMNEYLKIYGSFEDKMQAINAEFSAKLEQADTTGDKLMIQKQWEEAISQIKVDDLKDKLDWETVFGDLENIAIDKLQEIKAALRDALDARDITAENAKVIVDQLNKVESAINSKSAMWADLFPNSGIAKVIAERQKTKSEINSLMKYAKQEEDNAARYGFQADTFKDSITSAFKEVGLDLKDKDLTIGNSEALVEQFKQAKGNEADMRQMMQGFFKMQSAQQASAANAAGAKAKAGAKGGGGFAQTMAILDAVFTGIHDNVESLRGFLKDLGKDDTPFAKKFNTLADSYDNAFKGWESFKKGDAVGVIRNNYEAWNKMFDVFESNNMAELNEEIEHLTYATQDLQKAFSKLVENIESSTLYNANENYEKAKKNLDQQQVNTMKIMADEAKKWEHGSNSINYKLNTNKDFLTAIQQAGRIVGKSFVSSEGFLGNMTGADYEKLRTENTGLYTIIKNFYRDAENKHTGSGESIANMFDTMADSFGEDAAKNLEDAINKTLSGITFDSLESNFLSTLNDMESDVDTFGENLENTLRNAVINGVMKNYSSDLEQWYTEFSNAMAGGLTNAEASALRTKYQQITNLAVSERDAALKTLGLDEDAKISATQRSVASMSEDTASELNGRFTALQISGNSIDKNLQTLARDVQSNAKETHRLLNKMVEGTDDIADNTGQQQEVKARLEVGKLEADVDTSALQGSIDGLASAVKGIQTPNIEVESPEVKVDVPTPQVNVEQDTDLLQNVIQQVNSALMSLAGGNAQNLSMLTSINSSMGDAVSAINSVQSSIMESNSLLASINMSVLACNGTLNAIYNTNDAGFRNLQNEVRAVASAINNKL